jgi:hypothetical protein
VNEKQIFSWDCLVVKKVTFIYYKSPIPPKEEKGDFEAL